MILRLLAFAHVLGPMSESLKSAFVCVCARSFAFVNTPFYCTPFCDNLRMGNTPSTAGTFRKKFRKNSGKTPETLSEHFLEFPSRVRLGSLKPYNSRHLSLPEHFQNSLPPLRLGTPLFSDLVPERASQSWSWNFRQYWGYF